MASHNVKKWFERSCSFLNWIHCIRREKCYRISMTRFVASVPYCHLSMRHSGSNGVLFCLKFPFSSVFVSCQPFAQLTTGKIAPWMHIQLRIHTLISWAERAIDSATSTSTVLEYFLILVQSACVDAVLAQAIARYQSLHSTAIMMYESRTVSVGIETVYLFQFRTFRHRFIARGNDARCRCGDDTERPI